MSFKNKTKIIKTTNQSVGNNQRGLMRTLNKNKGICLIMEKTRVVAKWRLILVLDLNWPRKWY